MLELPQGTRRLLCVRAAMFLLNKSEDDVVYMIEDRQFAAAFDLARPDAARRELRIWAGCIEGRTVPLDEVMRDVLPKHSAPILRVQEIANAWNCSRTHVCGLLDCGELAEHGAQTGVTGVRRATRESVIEFMKRRLA